MQKSDVRTKLEQFFVEREGEGVRQDLDQVDLMASGMLDSLDMVTLAVFIEKEFGVKISLATDETLEQLHRFPSIVDLVCEHAAQPAA